MGVVNSWWVWLVPESSLEKLATMDYSVECIADCSTWLQASFMYVTGVWKYPRHMSAEWTVVNTNTVKPALVTTCILNQLGHVVMHFNLHAPLYKDHFFLAQTWSLNTGFHCTPVSSVYWCKTK